MKSRMTIEDLHSQGYDTVIVAAPDMHGRLIGKRLTPKKFESILDLGIAVSSCTFGWDLPQNIGLEVPYAGWHTGWRDFMLVPDLATLVPAAWLESTAIVIADIVEEHDRKPVEITPRRILQQQIRKLAERGLKIDVGTELEFYLFREGYDELRNDGFRELTPSTLIHSDYTVQQVNAWEPFFRRLRNYLDASGIDVEMSQGEWGLGQWEINLNYGEALDMCDRHTLFKLAVKDVASQAGFSVTFMPKPVAASVGSSCHVHVSLKDVTASDSTSNIAFPFWSDTSSDHMSETMKHAVGGVLAHAPDLMAIYAPTINSYRRTNSSEFAGNGATWGYDNRTVSCRVLGTTPTSMRAEWRVPGADTNAYLTVAALIASIDDGIANKTDPGPASHGDSYQKEAGIKFPVHLGQAAEALGVSAFAKKAFSEPVVEQYAIAAQWEWQQFLEAVTDWELDRYYENI